MHNITEVITDIFKYYAGGTFYNPALSSVMGE